MKRRTVLVWCINVDSDGTPVDINGEPTFGNRKALHTWEKMRRTEKWMAEHPNLWKPLDKE